MRKKKKIRKPQYNLVITFLKVITMCAEKWNQKTVTEPGYHCWLIITMIMCTKGRNQRRSPANSKESQEPLLTASGPTEQWK